MYVKIMRRKIKRTSLQGLPKDETDEELERILEEGGEEPLDTSQTPISSNGTYSQGVEESGFYLEYDGLIFFNRANGSDGLERGEIKPIAKNKMLRKVCEERLEALDKRTLLPDAYVLVRGRTEEKVHEFYVHVDDMGTVWLPELVGSNTDGPRSQRIYGKTGDISKILMAPDSEVYDLRGKKSENSKNPK